MREDKTGQKHPERDETSCVAVKSKLDGMNSSTASRLGPKPTSMAVGTKSEAKNPFKSNLKSVDTGTSTLGQKLSSLSGNKRTGLSMHGSNKRLK